MLAIWGQPVTASRWPGWPRRWARARRPVAPSVQQAVLAPVLLLAIALFGLLGPRVSSWRSAAIAVTVVVVAGSVIGAWKIWEVSRQRVQAKCSELSDDFRATSWYTPLAGYPDRGGEFSAPVPDGRRPGMVPSAADPLVLASLPAADDSYDKQLLTAYSAVRVRTRAEFYLAYAAPLPESYAAFSWLPYPARPLLAWSRRANRLLLAGSWAAFLAWLGLLIVIGVGSSGVLFWATLSLMVVIAQRLQPACRSRRRCT
jgi:hypothetical protein